MEPSTLRFTPSGAAAPGPPRSAAAALLSTPVATQVIPRPWVGSGASWVSVRQEGAPDNKHQGKYPTHASQPVEAAQAPDATARAGGAGGGGSAGVPIAPPTGARLVGAQRRTTKYGNKYERAKLVGEWATRLSLGEDPELDLSTIPEAERHKFSNPIHLALLALRTKSMPLGIRRVFSDGAYEDWFLDELVFF
jgi:hypothetical protein